MFVTGGGSGFQHGFTFDEEVNEDDIALEKGGVTFADRPNELSIFGGGAEI